MGEREREQACDREPERGAAPVPSEPDRDARDTADYEHEPAQRARSRDHRDGEGAYQPRRREDCCREVLHAFIVAEIVGSARSDNGIGHMSQPRVRVVVVDDHPFFRDGISRGLSLDARIEVIGEAGSGHEAIEMIGRELPDVAVVDYQMPDINGVGVVHALRRDGIATRVLLVSAVTEGAVVFKALQEGAAGYIAKDARRSEVIDAIIKVSRGETVVPPELAAGLVDQIRLRADAVAPVLTDREMDVLRRFATGLSIPQVAAELYLAPSTVKTHTQRLYEKLGVSDRAAAVAAAMRLGLLE